ncbi:hypothetical protein H261_06596 [Paramagnetospirillum caucaseum]|uniref:Uncharacterized protein n=1 Tax=Paramagnetospirillum caucaseum TaxID=1244869 RepID=M2ZTK5_9PROT|nr:hypothetical protein [Paramagnetospirillum caucaseum]EME70707.1 hypothetical protein H261_06596 [Paramagnetospirillum caucaseum]
MSSLTQLIAGLHARKGYDRIAAAHLLESGFHGEVDAAAERIGALCSKACARLSAQALSLEARLRSIADAAPSHPDQALRHEADAGTARLEATGNAALEEIHILAVTLSLKTQEAAGRAADALGECSEACRPESGLAANIVLDAADHVSAALRRRSTAASRDIRATLGSAGRRIEAVAGKTASAGIGVSRI